MLLLLLAPAKCVSFFVPSGEKSPTPFADLDLHVHGQLVGFATGMSIL